MHADGFYRIFKEVNSGPHISIKTYFSIIIAGLARTIVVDISIRAGAFRVAGVRWITEYNNYQVKNKKWKAKRLLHTRNLLLHEFRFASIMNSYIAF